MLQSFPHCACLVLVFGVFLTSSYCETDRKSQYLGTRRQSTSTEDEENVGCLLPPPQPNGRFSHSPRRCPPDNTFIECQMTPGNPVPHDWVLFHSCDSGYILNNTVTTASVCLNGTWRPVLPTCIKLCPALTSPDVGISCVFRGKEVKCDGETRPGVVASAECQLLYRTSFQLRCLDSGNWTVHNQSSQQTVIDGGENKLRDFRCIPECGLSPRNFQEDSKETMEPSQEIVYPFSTKPGEFPWLAAIYQNRSDEWELRCLGTLISPHIVVTAAQCVTSVDNGRLDPGKLRVGLGKYYRDFHKPESSSIISEIREVVIPRSYAGEATFYEMNIALLDLLVEVKLSALIVPACIDLSQGHIPDSEAVVNVAEWSMMENGTRSETLESAQFNTLGLQSCKARTKPNSTTDNLLTLDKFCIVENHGRQFYELMTGAGITHEKDGRHFLIGFTTAPGGRYTSVATNMTFSGHSRWLKTEIDRLEKQRILK